MKHNRLLASWIICLSFLFITACSSTDKLAEKVTHLETKSESKDEIKVHFIDVGQGASQLIIGSSGKTILIDAGNNNKEKLIAQYLKKEKINKIDILIGTHPDADHIGGLDSVINHFDIGKIYMPKIQSNTQTFEDVLTAIQNKGLKVSSAKAGTVLDWEPDSAVEIIAPVGEYSEANEMSAVVRLTFGAATFLFTGDAAAKSEQDMLTSKAILKSDVLLIGHHGSASSTSQAFLDAVHPSYAVIQSGDNNYGHPTAEVLKRLSDKGIPIYRNDELGNIIFTSNGKDITVHHDHWNPVTGEIKTMPVTAPVTPVPQPAAAPASTPTIAPIQQESNAVYNNCTQVKAAGKAPLHRGEPGYSNKLDRDNDGIACE
jgi:competence protein ComEC